MDIFLTRALQLIVSLSILVLIHEFGHYLFSRLFKVRVERFYLFFNPLFSIVRIKKLGGKLKFAWFSRKAPETFKEATDQTEFGVGWVPLGGYCAISGMIDESMNVEQMAQPEQPWEFRSKPAWQRLLIMAGGVVFNFILALVIYSAVLYTWGEEYVPIQEAPMGMEFSPVGHDLGFMDGDRLLAADGVAFERFDEHTLRAIDESKTVTVWRDGAEVEINVPDGFIERIIEAKQGFAAYRFPTVIREITNGSPAKNAGLLPNDSLTAINGVSTLTFSAFADALFSHKDSLVTLTYYRSGVEQQVQLQPDENGKLGFYPKMYSELFPTRKLSYSVLASIPAGIKKGVKKLTGYASDMKFAFTKEGAKSLGGFGAIGSLFPPSWSWSIFWETTAFLSIILAFMNILPIPALDGGHIMFLLFEVVTRRKPGDKFMEYAQMVGMFLLLALLVYANGNDLYRWLFK